MSTQPLQQITGQGLVIEPFIKTLAKNSLVLSRYITKTLQINVGLVCNQACKHCHLEAGPDRKESMNRDTAELVVEYAVRGGFETADITGGAAELNPNLPFILENLAPAIKRVMFRANLTALFSNDGRSLLDLLVRNKTVIAASFPSINRDQADSQRGSGIFEKSLAALKELNALGYGRDETGLELNLISNPAGAFLPQDQTKAEKRFRDQLAKKHGLVFSNLYTFANVPLGRFKNWLENSGNYHGYLERLATNFNSCAVNGLMCRNQVSVAWDGFLYDCDFNIAAGIHLGGGKIHVSDMPGPPEPGSPIATGDHCYTCTAGAGFT